MPTPEEFQDIAPEDQQEDESDLPKDKIGDPSQSVLFNTDWTVSTIVQQIERKNIDLDPEFQRRTAWDATRRSRLIESLIIGMPIPNIVLAETKEARGRFIVIDGKQRLASLYDFISEQSATNFSLSGLEIKQNLNGLTFKDLKSLNSDDATYLENSPIRTVVIRNWPTDYFLYVLFDRLNSGSLPLSPQELRRALLPGAFLDYVDEFLANSVSIKRVLGISKPDRRMRDSEIVLRYVALERKYPEYGGNFKEFLDEAVKYYNAEWDARKPELDSILSKLEKALEVSSRIFEPHQLFRKWNGTKFENRMNRALFDAVVRYFSDPSVEAAAVARKDKIVEAMKHICVNDADFKRAIELTTKTPVATATRLAKWGAVLAHIIGREYDVPSFRIK